jgi:hypothetical protein
VFHRTLQDSLKGEGQLNSGGIPRRTYRKLQRTEECRCDGQLGGRCDVGMTMLEPGRGVKRWLLKMPRTLSSGLLGMALSCLRSGNPARPF